MFQGPQQFVLLRGENQPSFPSGTALLPFSRPTVSLPQVSANQEVERPKTFTIRVKIAHPGKRGAKTFAMRGFRPDLVKSPLDLEENIRKEFQPQLGKENGKFEGLGVMKGGSKISIRSKEDVEDVMKSIKDNSDVTLWCSYSPSSGKGDDGSDSSSSEDDDHRRHKSKSKRRRADPNQSKDTRIAAIIRRLKEAHGHSYTSLQYRLWAEMLDIETHDSFESPPDVPMFSGGGQSRKKSCFASTVTELGSAIATAVVGLSGGPSGGSNTASAESRAALSMNSERKAQAQRDFVHQLRDLHNLLEIGAIDTADYNVQKKRILDELSSF